MSATCTASGCTRPTQTMLCRSHLDELVDALRELAYSTVERRDDADRHTDHLPRQGLLADLQDTATRRDHTGPTVGKISRHDAVSIEYHVAASHIADRARATISTCAREIWEANRHLHLPPDPAAAAEWLARLPGILAMHPTAGEMWRDVTSIARRIRRVIDRRPDLTYLGMCSASTESGELCEWDIYAEKDADIVQCMRCTTTHDVRTRQAVMLRAMEAQLLPATDLRTVLTRYMPQGVPPIGTIYRWASTGKLARKPPLPGHSSPRYRIGDALDLIARQQKETA